MGRPDMTNDQPQDLEEKIPLLLAACDEAIADGIALPATNASPEILKRLQNRVDWCRKVRMLWPRGEQTALASTLLAPATAGNRSTTPNLASPTCTPPLRRLGRFE